MPELYDAINERLAAEAEGREARRLAAMSSVDYEDRYYSLLVGAGRAARYLASLTDPDGKPRKPDVRIEQRVIQPARGSINKIKVRKQGGDRGVNLRKPWKLWVGNASFLAPSKPVDVVEKLKPGQRAKLAREGMLIEPLLGEGWSIVPELTDDERKAGLSPSQKTGTVITPEGAFADFSRIKPEFVVEDPSEISDITLPNVVAQRQEQLATLIHERGLPLAMFDDL